MKSADLPPEARRLWKLFYQDEDSELHDLRFNEGITERLFAELLVGCLYRNHKRAEKFIEHDRRNHRRLASKKGMQHFRKLAADSIPTVARIGKGNLEIQVLARQHHDSVAAWAKAQARFFGPMVCLYALFKYLVKPQRVEDEVDGSVLSVGIECHMTTSVPDILKRAGIRPHKKSEWTPVNISRTFRRHGGTAAADRAAFYLFSTDDRLKPYRPPAPPEHPRSGPPDPDLMASLIGRAMFRLPAPRKSAAIKPSKGGQQAHKNAQALSAR
jgi:hypothetical protein